MAESWREVADALAERLRYQASQCTAGYLTTGDGYTTNVPLPEDGSGIHRDPIKHADECPYCADTVAVMLYDKKAGL